MRYYITMSGQTMIYRPRAKVIFSDLEKDKMIIDCSDDLISLSTNKAYGRGSGTWQIILPYKIVKDEIGKTDYYHKLLKPNDLVRIYIDAGDGDGEQIVMLGLIDRTSAVRQGGAAINRQIKISGQDMGKILSNHDVGWDLMKDKMQIANSGETEEEIETQTMQAESRLANNPAYSIGTAQHMMQNMYMLMFYKNIATYVSQHFSIARLKDTDDDWVLLSNTFNSLRGVTLWNAMKSVENNPYNMLHADTNANGKFEIILEKQPIGKDGKLNRALDRQHNIAQYHIISDDVGVSDGERVNFIYNQVDMFFVQIGIQVECLMISPCLIEYDKDEIKKHGYHVKSFSTNFLPPTMKTSSQPATQAEFQTTTTRTKLFWSWYNDSHTFESGTFVVHISPRMKTGDVLIVEVDDNNKMEYLIEQISHQISFHPTTKMTTTVQVTRGKKH